METHKERLSCCCWYCSITQLEGRKFSVRAARPGWRRRGAGGWCTLDKRPTRYLCIKGHTGLAEEAKATTMCVFHTLRLLLSRPKRAKGPGEHTHAQTHSYLRTQAVWWEMHCQKKLESPQICLPSCDMCLRVPLFLWIYEHSWMNSTDLGLIVISADLIHTFLKVNI